MKVIPRINDKLYVRFGEIPKNEKSNIYKGDTGRPADAPWFLVGTKKLNMRTTGYHFTTTIFNGTWYLSERDI